MSACRGGSVDSNEADPVADEDDSALSVVLRLFEPEQLF